MIRALILGIMASFFFAFTFIFNHQMDIAGGSWLWSTVGFGIFYAPLSFASVFGPSWLVAATWQITIIAGALMSPLFYQYSKTEQGICRTW